MIVESYFFYFLNYIFNKKIPSINILKQSFLNKKEKSAIQGEKHPLLSFGI